MSDSPTGIDLRLLLSDGHAISPLSPSSAAFGGLAVVVVFASVVVLRRRQEGGRAPESNGEPDSRGAADADRVRHDRNRHSDLFYRWINEIPALPVLVGAVLLVVFKPF